MGLLGLKGATGFEKQQLVYNWHSERARKGNGLPKRYTACPGIAI
jgi:hypothetical protein